MKLFCPYCGIEGMAKDALYNKKVNCPACEKHFTIECSVIVGPHQKATKINLSRHTDIPSKKNQQVEDQTLEKQEVTSNQKREAVETETKNKPDPLNRTEQICSSCGTRIKKGYEYTLGHGTYCTECTPIPKEA